MSNTLISTNFHTMNNQHHYADNAASNYKQSQSESPPRMPQNHEEVFVQYRNKGGSSTPNYRSNRHSYHGPMNSVLNNNVDPRRSYIPEEWSGYSTGHRNTLTPQRSLDERDAYRCARNRLSGNFGYLSVLPEDSMNSNDSVVGNRVPVDTMQTGPDMQESPRSAGSVVSGVSLKREDVGRGGHQQLPQHVPPQAPGVPLQGQVLVDPATGQHYIVPQAAFYQPVQPMYYPPPQAQPMYYPPYGQPITSQQGYMMGSTGHLPQGAYPVPMHPNPPVYTQGGQARPFTGSSQAGYRQGYGQHVASTEDLSRRDAEERRFEDHPPLSPSLSTHIPPHMYPVPQYAASQISTFSQQYRPHQSNPNMRGSPNSQPEDPESGRDHFRRDVTRSSAEFAPRTSGEFQRDFARGSGGESHFARNGSGSDLHAMRHGSGADLQRQGQGSGGDLRRDSAELQRPREGGDSQRSLPEQRTPLYGGPPQWWGRDREDGTHANTDVESRRPVHSSPPLPSTVSDSETVNRPSTVRHPPPAKPVRMDIDLSGPQEEAPVKPKPANRAVRMDFDLSKTLPEEEELLAKKKAAPRVPATAFTVTFDQPTEAVSLQDAARKSAQARRVLGRRSGVNSAAAGPARPPQDAKATPTQGANKNFLLNKLLNGSSSEAGAEFPDVAESRDNDAVSETGTFVVDVSARATASNVMASRIMENSDDSTDTDSDSDSSRTASPVRTPVPSTSNDKPEGNGEMLKGLCKLRQMAGIRPATAPAPAPPPSVPIRPSRLPDPPRGTAAPSPGPAAPSLPPVGKRSSLGGPPSSAQSNRSVHGSSGRSNNYPASTASTTNTFRRGDGGRFSMRGATAPGSASPAGSKRPPFRAGGVTARVPENPLKQREQEMNAWLRRKDYNPMKAAAEAKRQKEQQARSDQFVSNRSISFHVGPTGSKPKQPSFNELSRNRSQESLAADEAEQASQRIVAEYSRGVVKDINRLSQQNHRTGGQKSGLARAVDMLSQKCKKSIELIRSQNKGCLSVSVEDLLSAAADPPREDESLNEQLERLSDAFDAVQRYLEQYSLDGHQSPIPEFNEEPETNSVVSGFSGFSLRSHQLSRERLNRPPSTGNTAPAARSVTTAYRSRVLANRSPSSGRPGRDN